MAVTFNINDEVWVEINERGWEAFDKFHRKLGLDPDDYRSIMKPDYRGRYKMQMHQVMQIFGEAMFMGPFPPIGMEVEFV